MNVEGVLEKVTQDLWQAGVGPRFSGSGFRLKP